MMKIQQKINKIKLNTITVDAAKPIITQNVTGLTGRLLGESVEPVSKKKLIIIAIGRN